MRIVIVDDELAARRRLKRLLDGAPGATIVGEFVDGNAAIEGIRKLEPDVVLLDIHIPEKDGLEVARAIQGPRGPAVVFVTAFDQYALRAFEVHAVDYLVKPIDGERLHAALARVEGQRGVGARSGVDLRSLTQLIEAMRRHQLGETDIKRRPRDRLLVAMEGRSIVVPVAELDWIEAAGNYVRLHRGNQRLMMREPLASIETSLDPQVFARVHRGAIVNISRIKEVQPWFSGAAILILTTGQRLTVSRSYRKEFEARFGIVEEV